MDSELVRRENLHVDSHLALQFRRKERLHRRSSSGEDFNFKQEEKENYPANLVIQTELTSVSVRFP